MKGCSFASVTGNVTRDPELKYTKTGTALCNFSVAVNGFKKDDVSFIQIVAWNRGEKYKLAEICSQYLSKGSPVQVIGKIKEDRWEDKETGKKRSKIYIVADEIVFLGKNENPDSSSTDRKEPDVAAAEEDIPF